MEGKVAWLYLSYVHLSTHLAPPILDLLQEKTVLEVGDLSPHQSPPHPASPYLASGRRRV